MSKKVCRACGNSKPRDTKHFYKRGKGTRGSDGLDSYCILCRREMAKENYRFSRYGGQVLRCKDCLGVQTATLVHASGRQEQVVCRTCRGRGSVSPRRLEHAHAPDRERYYRLQKSRST